MASSAGLRHRGTQIIEDNKIEALIKHEKCDSGNTEEYAHERNINRVPRSQTPRVDVPDPDSAVNTSTSAQNGNVTSCVPSKRSMTKRGRFGKKWVSLNYERKERLKAANNGVMPHSDALTTSPFPHSDEWSEDNLPDILFYIKLPRSEYEGQPVSMLTENNMPVTVGEHGKPLRDIPVLPRRISLEVPGWLVEAWRRLDPRIKYSDILDRQVEDYELGLYKIDRNAFQNHCRRECRMVLSLWTSYDRRDVPHRTDVEAIETLTSENIMFNTVLHRCPRWPHRLTKIRLTRRTQDGCGKYYAEPRKVDDNNVLDTTFPIDQFMLEPEAFPIIIHSMDRAMLAAWELSLILGERASIHGVNHWSKLADECRPSSWFDRTREKRADNDTFDRGCSVCTWNPERDQRIHKNYIHRNASRSTLVSSSRPSKKRKVNNDSDQNVSTVLADKHSAKECLCCEEAQADNFRHLYYPSDRFRRGEYQSFYRDRDDATQDVQIHTTGSSMFPDAFYSSRQSGAQVGPNTIQQAGVGNSEAHVLRDSERDLSGIGSHLVFTKRRNSHQLLHTPNNEWYPPYSGLPAGIDGDVAVWNQLSPAFKAPSQQYLSRPLKSSQDFRSRVEDTRSSSGASQNMGGYDDSISTALSPRNSHRSRSSVPPIVSDESELNQDLVQEIDDVLKATWPPRPGHGEEDLFALHSSILSDQENMQLTHSPESLSTSTEYIWEYSDPGYGAAIFSFTNPSVLDTSSDVESNSSSGGVRVKSASPEALTPAADISLAGLSPLGENRDTSGRDNVDSQNLTSHISTSTMELIACETPSQEQIPLGNSTTAFATRETSASENRDLKTLTESAIAGDDSLSSNHLYDEVWAGSDST